MKKLLQNILRYGSTVATSKVTQKAAVTVVDKVGPHTALKKVGLITCLIGLIITLSGWFLLSSWWSVGITTFGIVVFLIGLAMRSVNNILVNLVVRLFQSIIKRVTGCIKRFKDGRGKTSGAASDDNAATAMSIRDLEFSDIEPVASLAQEVLDDDPERVRGVLKFDLEQGYLGTYGWLRVAEIQPNLIIGWTEFSYDESENRIYLSNLAVLPKYQNRGIVGNNMMEDLLVVARSCEVEKIWLQVAHGNDRAIRFYERHGFEITEKRHKTFVMERLSL